MTRWQHGGLDNRINQAPHHGKGFVAMEFLVLQNSLDMCNEAAVPYTVYTLTTHCLPTSMTHYAAQQMLT